MRSWMRGYMYTCKKYKDRRYFTLSGGEKAGKRRMALPGCSMSISNTIEYGLR